MNKIPAPAPLTMTTERIVAACRALGGRWLDHFCFHGAQWRWFFTPPGGDPVGVKTEEMPGLAHLLGGWPAATGAERVRYA